MKFITNIGIYCPTPITALLLMLSFMTVSDCQRTNHSDFSKNDVATAPEPGRIAGFPETVLEPYSGNEQTFYIELVLVVDNGVYIANNRNLKATHQYCKDLVKIVNSLYEPLNIFIALVDVKVWIDKNQIDLSIDVSKTLSNFNAYRNKVPSHTQLLTSMKFEKIIAGLAYGKTICIGGMSCSVVTISEDIKTSAVLMAHEIGHSFGMDHDTSECKCEDESCIMTKTIKSFVPTQWSSCSINTVKTIINMGMNRCLKNVPKYLFESPTCGNGFVEKGEECDCGLPSVCKNTCCDPVTCKLRSNATCASGKCCDLNTCQPHEAGFRCRSSTGECDFPEFCDGKSEFCPNDDYKQDGAECGGGKAYCYKGSCKTHDDQCRLLWGPSANSVEECYVYNSRGKSHGNCGSCSTNHFIGCSIEDVNCGLLQCNGKKLQVQGIVEYSLTNITTKRGQTCSTVTFQYYDLGMVPDGVKCGNSKICKNQKCISIESLHTNGSGHVSPKVCNNVGQRDDGFAPPLCDAPGSGGPIQSGPAKNPTSGFVQIVYIFFLGVVPCVLLSIVLYFYLKRRGIWLITEAAAEESNI